MEISKAGNEMVMGRPTLTNQPEQPQAPTSSKSGEVTPTVAKQVGQSTSVSFDKDANMFVMKFMNKDNKEVIQQVPAQVMIEFAKQVNQTLGNIIDTKA